MSEKENWWNSKERLTEPLVISDPKVAEKILEELDSPSSYFKDIEPIPYEDHSKEIWEIWKKQIK